jgi:hypothetical protein
LFFSFILICPLLTLPVQLEERAIFPSNSNILHPQPP